MTRNRFWHPLMEQYPQFFSPDRTDYGLIDGGITCGRGWDAILTELFESLAGWDLPPEFRITQVKQKFGQLRVYHNGQMGLYGPHVGSAIYHANLRSTNTCEQCGETGMLEEHNQVWQTLCASCRQRRSEL